MPKTAPEAAKRKRLASSRAFLLQYKVKKEHTRNLSYGMPPNEFTRRPHLSAVQLQTALDFVHNPDVDIQDLDSCIECGALECHADTRLCALTCRHAPTEKMRDNFSYGGHRHGFLICAACWIGEHCAFTEPENNKGEPDSAVHTRRIGKRKVFTCQIERSGQSSVYNFCETDHEADALCI